MNKNKLDCNKLIPDCPADHKIMGDSCVPYRKTKINGCSSLQKRNDPPTGQVSYTETTNLGRCIQICNDNSDSTGLSFNHDDGTCSIYTSTTASQLPVSMGTGEKKWCMMIAIPPNEKKNLQNVANRSAANAMNKLARSPLAQQIGLGRLQSLLQAGDEMALQAAFLVDKLWDNGSTLTVSFLGGSTDDQNWVKHIIKTKFEPHVNLKFDFIGGSNGMIRISFDQNGGAWSYLGTDALSQYGPTMNLGWLDRRNSSGGEGSGAVILHEFGHAIGMIHEHQNPSGHICWNKQQVYNDLSGPPNNWNKSTIDNNMFFQYDANSINGSIYDSSSIMHYYFPNTWIENGSGCSPYGGTYNTALSGLDVEWMGKLYPGGKGAEVTAVDCQVSEWSDWSECSVSCGGGTQSRERTITQEAQNGGESCDSFNLLEVKDCNMDYCTNESDGIVYFEKTENGSPNNKCVNLIDGDNIDNIDFSNVVGVALKPKILTKHYGRFCRKAVADGEITDEESKAQMSEWCQSNSDQAVCAQYCSGEDCTTTKSKVTLVVLVVLSLISIVLTGYIVMHRKKYSKGMLGLSLLITTAFMGLTVYYILSRPKFDGTQPDYTVNANMRM